MATSTTIDMKYWREFMTLYRSLPEIWNSNCEAYRCRRLRDKAYNKMLVKMHEIDPEANIVLLKRKINNLRTSYRRELRKLQVSQQTASEPSDLYVPTLWYFEDLDFLRELENLQALPNAVLRRQRQPRRQAVVVKNDMNHYGTAANANDDDDNEDSETNTINYDVDDDDEFNNDKAAGGINDDDVDDCDNDDDGYNNRWPKEEIDIDDMHDSDNNMDCCIENEIIDAQHSDVNSDTFNEDENQAIAPVSFVCVNEVTEGIIGADSHEEENVHIATPPSLRRCSTSAEKSHIGNNDYLHSKHSTYHNKRTLLRARRRQYVNNFKRSNFNQSNDVAINDNSATIDETAEECDLVGKRFAKHLKLMQPTQRLYAERIISEVLIHGRLNKLKMETKFITN